MEKFSQPSALRVFLPKMYRYYNVKLVENTEDEVNATSQRLGEKFYIVKLVVFK